AVTDMPLSSSGSRNVLSGLTAITLPLSSVRPGSHPVGRKHHLHADPHQRHGDQRLPSEAHDLVVAVAGERGPEPQEQEQQYENLEAEPAEARVRERRGADAWIPLKRRQPAAEEHDRG